MESTLGTPTASAVTFFLIIVALTLAVTYWAARRTRSTNEFYAAGRSVTPLQNGLALSGDYMSAASFLGIAGLVALSGYDGMIYATGWLVGWPALMFLVAEPLRNLGKYTFADVVAFRLRQVPVRVASAVGGILTLLLYVLAQMVGAGNLIALMFGLNYQVAVLCVGGVMLAYVLFGGMIATTWVQIIKAILLLFGVTLLTVLVLAQFDFSLGTLYAAVAARYGQTALEPGGLVSNPFDTVSLGMALMFGLLGLPHILMRFYTVPDARAARLSVLYATGFIGYFYLIIPIVGFGASALVGRDVIRRIDSGGNMAAPLVAELLGGTPFLGFIAAVAFATILAVVAGLTLAGASTLSHDIFMHVVRKGKASDREQIDGRPRGDRCVRRHRSRARHPVRRPERRLHGRPGVCRGVQRKLPAPAPVDCLAPLQHRRSGDLDPLGRHILGRSDRAQPDRVGRPARICSACVPASQPRHRFDASQLSLWGPGVTAHARARGGGAIR